MTPCIIKNYIHIFLQNTFTFNIFKEAKAFTTEFCVIEDIIMATMVNVKYGQFCTSYTLFLTFLRKKNSVFNLLLNMHFQDFF